MRLYTVFVLMIIPWKHRSLFLFLELFIKLDIMHLLDLKVMCMMEWLNGLVCFVRKFYLDFTILTHCGLVTPYGDIDLGQCCLR